MNQTAWLSSVSHQMGDMIEDECDVTLSPDFKTAQFGKDRMPTIEEIELE